MVAIAGATLTVIGHIQLVHGAAGVVSPVYLITAGLVLILAACGVTVRQFRKETEDANDRAERAATQRNADPNRRLAHVREKLKELHDKCQAFRRGEAQTTDAVEGIVQESCAFIRAALINDHYARDIENQTRNPATDKAKECRSILETCMRNMLYPHQVRNSFDLDQWPLEDDRPAVNRQ